MKRRILIPVIIIAAIAIFFGGWQLMYPDLGDPRNVRYVFWNAGLCSMDLDIATDTMIGDSDRASLVVGKTVPELRSRFGFLLESTQALPYLRNCYQTSFWKDKKVLFIRTKPWMVVIEGDRATELVLIKGC